jgi:hypothetical protein
MCLLLLGGSLDEVRWPLVKVLLASFPSVIHYLVRMGRQGGVRVRREVRMLGSHARVDVGRICW